MTDENASGTLPQARPYSPSWVDQLIIWLKRVPGPTWLPYLVIAIVGVAIGHVPGWSRGNVVVGSPELDGFYWGLLPAAVLLVAAYVRRLTNDSFDNFQPALSLPEEEAEALRYRLVFLPALPAFAITAGAIVLTGLSLSFDPEGSGIVGAAWPGIVAVAVIQSFAGSILFQLLYRLVRQARIIRETLAAAVVVDLFRPGPLQALANLGAWPGALLTLIVASSVVVQPLPADLRAFLIGWAPYLVLPPIIAAVAFVAPLTGLHRQLAAQKGALEDAAALRLKAVLAELNRDLDATDLTRIEKVNAALQSQIAHRDLLASLPTWPWSGTTLRRFVSAILLPLALFLVQQAADGIL